MESKNQYTVTRYQSFNIQADNEKDAIEAAKSAAKVYNNESFMKYFVEKQTDIQSNKKDSQYESDDEMVSHPKHYQSKNGLEVIDVIEAFTDGLNGIEAVDTANVIKYICRWKQKNGIQDLEKAVWYITNLINYLKEKGENKNEN